VFDELVLSPFVSRQLLLVFSVQRLICAAYFPLLHTEAAVVALEAAVAADHTPARRTSCSVFSVYIFLTDQILQLVGQSRRWKNESVDEIGRFESDLHPLTMASPNFSTGTRSQTSAKARALCGSHSPRGSLP